MLESSLAPWKVNVQVTDLREYLAHVNKENKVLFKQGLSLPSDPCSEQGDSLDCEMCRRNFINNK